MSEHVQLSTDQTGWAQKTFKAYVLGFVMCMMLTVMSFYIVQEHTFNKEMIYVLLTVFALAQLLIQSVCFLGLKSDANGRWNLMPFLFTMLIIFFLVGGSLWIMYNLNVLMMTGPMGS